MDLSVCSTEFSGFQPVSLRIFCVLPKIIFSSDGRINRGDGSNLALHTGQTDCSVQQFANPISPGGTKIVGLTTLPFHCGEIEIRARYH